MSHLSNRKAQDALRAREDFLDRRRRDDFMEVLRAPAGRRVLHRLIEESGVFSASLTSSEESHFREGQRSVGVGLMEKAQLLDVELYLQMLREAIDDARTTHLLKQAAIEAAKKDEND